MRYIARTFSHWIALIRDVFVSTGTVSGNKTDAPPNGEAVEKPLNLNGLNGLSLDDPIVPLSTPMLDNPA
jgi:hypothetical protein